VIRVMLVDDHQLVRVGLAALLDAEPDLEVVAEAGDGRCAVEQARAVQPDLILMDLSMPVLNGTEATRLILAEQPDTKVVILTSFSERERVADALEAGAIGYLLKDSEPAQVVAALRAAAAGHAPLDPRVARALLPGPAPAVPDPPEVTLSGRETEVLALVGRGLGNKQIGRSLGITERTVKVHLGNIFRRIGVRDRTSAALWARDHLPGWPH
jgi:DNA-binding NarL/FixJ family response regulator